MKLLLVEDERNLSEALARHLRAVGFACEAAFTLAQAEGKIASYDYEVVVLDLNLPDGNWL